MADLEEKEKRLAERIVQGMQLPGETEKWVKCLKEENVFLFRKLLKKERPRLPSKYKKLYRAPDEKLEIALHHLRTVYPFFSKAEKDRSWKFLELKELQLNGGDPLNNKIH